MVEYRLWSPDGTQGKWKTLHLPVVGLITDQLNAPRYCQSMFGDSVYKANAHADTF